MQAQRHTLPQQRATVQRVKTLHISNYKNSPINLWPMHHGRNVGGEQIYITELLTLLNYLNYEKDYRVF